MYQHLSEHLRPRTIAKILEKEGIRVSRRGVLKLLSCYYKNGTIVRVPGSGRPSVVTAEVKKIVEDQMQIDDETTASQSPQLPRLWFVTVHHTQVQNIFRLDIQRKCIPPIN